MSRRALARARHLLSFLRLIAVRGGSKFTDACANTGPTGLLAVPALFQWLF